MPATSPGGDEATWLVALLNATEFWAAIIGAVVGGFISLVLQRREHAAAAKQRADDRLSIHKTLGYSILFKTMKMHTFGHRSAQSYEEGFERATNEGLRPGAVIRAVGNLPPQIELTADEMSLVLAFKVDELTNGLMNLEAMHNSLLATQRSYNELRLRLEDALGGGQIIEGVLAETQLDERSLNRVAPIAAGLDDLAVQILTFVRDQRILADRILHLLGETLRDKLSLQIKLEPAERGREA